MRDYNKINDDELSKLCFVEADKKYVANVIKKSKQQMEDGTYKVIVSVDNMDEKHI